MPIESDLLREIDEFLAATGLAESTFGVRAVNDGKFVRRLRAGMPTIAARTVDRVRTYIRSQHARTPAAAVVAKKPRRKPPVASPHTPPPAANEPPRRSRKAA